MTTIDQLTLSTDLIRSLLEVCAIAPDQKVRLMSAQGTWQIIPIKQLMADNIELIVGHLNQSNS